MSEVVLVGGSKDGTVFEGESGLSAMHNIVLNEDLSGPEYVDRYVPTGVQDREGREVFAHVGRYTSEESESYWDKLDKDKVEELRAATLAEREAETAAVAEAEAQAAANQAEEEAKTEEAKPEVVQDEKTGELEEAPAEVTDEAVGEAVTEEKPDES